MELLGSGSQRKVGIGIGGVGLFVPVTTVLFGGKKVKLSLCLTKHHAMKALKAYCGSEDIAPRIL
jgi:hypothetical protein